MAAKRNPPIAFAHRGARSELPDNTIPAFRRALELGATGLESDVWVTADGVAVLDHDGIVKTARRRRMIRDMSRRQLPDHVPTLEELYGTCGKNYELSLDLKDPAAFDAVVGAARAAGDDAVARLWVLHTDWKVLAPHRMEVTDIRLMESTRLRRLEEGPERHAALLSAAGIDGINMHYSDWTLGLSTLFHRFDLFAFGWDAQHERMLRDLTSWEIDGVYCDDVARMMSVMG